MAKLFFLLSGEHPTLPLSELRAILEAEGYEYKIQERLPQVLLVKADSESVEAVESRSAMTRMCGLELFNCDATFPCIIDKARATSLEGSIERGESFAVRVRRVGKTAPNIARLELERKIGKAISNKAESVTVNLTKPQRTFFGVLSGNRFVFGLKMAEIPAKPFIERNPQKKPFFHPSAMSAKLARCMVNLARPKHGDLVLDPFCGTASILVEAGLMGCQVMGFDVQPHMVRGSLQNLLHYGLEPEGMAVADARRLPLIQTDCIVTDPPYGRSATTLGWNTQQLVEEALSATIERLSKDQRICIASPESIRIGEIGERLGLKHVESHLVYVHRSLTREIAVFERV
ncbi:MAG: THUMP domain-containing protein [Candidatus Bathyarchaeota archaeon]|nr:THUMP domain-containing protein [Candidatus Bathyarchaeota archaeon]